ncbi:MAG: carboxylating nicotinate-nucleotide diphosphorylase [Thermodesulfobacteria bacterium]|nr:carboxylating nicotinate-nucleotide diphosphorylase [Thermodesulfobacteriota bacterium]
MPEKWQILDLVKKAFEEDLYFGDITTELLVDPKLKGLANFVAKEDLVLCGTEVAKESFLFIDPELKVNWFFKDGDEVKARSIIGEVKGSVKSILKAERVALNFLQHLSGIATQVRKAVKILEPFSTKILDTRKTIPGLRVLQKYAVKVGGGLNHRHSLSEEVLIKDNHLVALGGLEKVIERLKKVKIPHYVKVEVEVSSIEELKVLLDKGKDLVDIVLLDNFSPEEVKQSVKLVKESGSKVKVEISGGITLENLTKFAEAGADYISSGALTHSVKAVDISLKLEKRSLT